MTNEQVLYLLDKVGIETENMIKLTKRSKHEQEIYNNELSKRCDSISSSKELLESNGQSKSNVRR